MGNPWDIKFNPFVGTGVGGSERICGGFSGGETRVGAQQGLSAVDKDLADMRRFIPAYNGTGELQPNNAEDGAKLKFLYA